MIRQLEDTIMPKCLLWLILILPAGAASNPLEIHRHAPRAETVKHIMDSMIDPNAEALWDSVASYASLDRVQEKSPRNDADWKELRRRASKLSMAAHLLVTPDRPVAEPGDQSKNPSIELSPSQIETLINSDKPAWRMLVDGLQTSATLVINAIDKKNLEQLRSANDALNASCEKCHQKYWYPNRSRLLQQ
jgi:hypothetical protein